ncbi:ScbR family autoregulator-binding transcription factor [Cryobacterium tepidiphilum]|uniref:TetR/AcrR family transcriptional regulator n=1 Tax=Cryobacterium tepidiphilum TaxID=2486026 RepID=A0A3M8L9U0_9MICO|nr:ScbR family autoregulator-binding transcription factor [Cryobacterium tepidiphilum]RNE62271.1 TetR/AcrR family transcriptional regulator [Cryobacterium tepidiphilum]
MARQARALATREAIIRGAAVVFERLGYGNASLADVAVEANVSKGALYFHFDSKDDLALAVIEEQNRISQVSGTAIIALGRPALETMILLCADLGRHLMTDPVVQAGIRLTTEAASFQPQVIEPYRDWLVTFENLIRTGIGEGDINENVAPDVLAWFIIPSFTGVQLVANVFTSRHDLLGRIRQMWEILLPSVTVPERYDDLRHLTRLVETPA